MLFVVDVWKQTIRREAGTSSLSRALFNQRKIGKNEAILKDW